MLVRGQKLGKYKILKTLGSGGFGTVYLASDTFIDKQVALKVPHRQNLDFGKQLQEPRLLATLNHPNVVGITTAEKQDNVFFIVMEYVPGETLEELITANGAIEIGQALEYTRQICKAVDHAHQQNVLHRDLRPGNVLISTNGVVKILDFGTSRYLEAAAHGTTIIGSPPYMAPEQFYGKAVLASDIYSLGVTMYEMLTGILPYDTPTPSDLEKLMSGKLVTAPRLRNKKIPTQISDIVMRAMAPEIPNRYQRAGDLHDALTEEPSFRLRPRVSNTRSASEANRIIPSLGIRVTPTPKFCHNCSKPLPGRRGTLSECPFCGAEIEP